MTSLKTITDEGKREFEDLHPCDHHPAQHCSCPEGLEWIEVFAQKIAESVYEAILPGKSKHRDAKMAKAWNLCRLYVETAFDRFMGKDV